MYSFPGMDCVCARLLWNGVGQHVGYGCVLVGYVGLVWSCGVVCGALRGLDEKETRINVFES